MSQGQPSSSRSIGILVAMEVDIWLPDQISGPPTGWRSAISKVAMLLASMDGQRGPALEEMEGHFQWPISELLRSEAEGSPSCGAEGAFIVKELRLGVDRSPAVVLQD